MLAFLRDKPYNRGIGVPQKRAKSILPPAPTTAQPSHAEILDISINQIKVVGELPPAFIATI